MTAWEIWSYDFPGIGPHPAVIISGPARAGAKPLVEVLRCGSVRAGRQAEAGEVLLDTADGLDWATLCFCDLVWTAERAGLKRKPYQSSASL